MLYLKIKRALRPQSPFNLYRRDAHILTERAILKIKKIIQNKYTNANIARKRTIFIEFGVMYVIIF